MAKKKHGKHRADFRKKHQGRVRDRDLTRRFKTGDQDDLADPKLLSDSHAALDELTRLLGLGSVFPFQR